MSVDLELLLAFSALYGFNYDGDTLVNFLQGSKCGLMMIIIIVMTMMIIKLTFKVNKCSDPLEKII